MEQKLYYTQLTPRKLATKKYDKCKKIYPFDWLNKEQLTHNCTDEPSNNKNTHIRRNGKIKTKNLCLR